MNAEIVRDEHGDRLPYAYYPHYWSTYCIHHNHTKCRRTCKTCKSPCLCFCHSRRSDASEVPSSHLRPLYDWIDAHGGNPDAKFRARQALAQAIHTLESGAHIDGRDDA